MHGDRDAKTGDNTRHAIRDTAEGHHASQHVDSTFPPFSPCFPKELSTWIGAKEVCQEMVPGAHLAFANSQKENSYIVSLNSSNSNTQLWLGGTDSTIEGNWTWTEGSMFTFTNWYSYEGNGGIAENCLALDTYNSATYWFDAACFHSKYFICEIDLF